ncbi:MAG TPA: enolase C-terminal domain-like protein, partial [Deinococcales bacterium]|nr:enolase C-terminal domain-like protein [Deinococcales bacterium]
AGLDQYGLLYIEQPLEHDDIVDHATLARRLATPLCLDESIHHAGDVRKAHQLGSGKVINLKLGRVGGHREAQRIAAYCADNGLGLWCGGMLESGVGRAHNLAMQSLSAFNHASDTAPSANYWDEDIIEPEITMTDGLVRVPDGPGIGVRLRQDLVEARTVRVERYA